MLGVVQADQDDDGNAASGIITQKATPSVAKPAPAANKTEEYQKLLEDFFKKPVKQWGETDKVLARKAFTDMQAGKPWATVQAELSKAVSFS
jgi:hypothetical protein